MDFSLPGKNRNKWLMKCLIGGRNAVKMVYRLVKDALALALDKAGSTTNPIFVLVQTKET